MPAAMNAIVAPGREPGRVRPSVSSAEPLSTNAERIDTCSTPQNTNMKPTRVSVSQATSVAIRPSGEYHASRRSRFASDNDGRASTRNTCWTLRKTQRVTNETLARGSTTVLIAEPSAITTSDTPNATARTRRTISTALILSERRPTVSALHGTPGRLPGPVPIRRSPC